MKVSGSFDASAPHPELRFLGRGNSRNGSFVASSGSGAASPAAAGSAAPSPAAGGANPSLAFKGDRTEAPPYSYRTAAATPEVHPSAAPAAAGPGSMMASSRRVPAQTPPPTVMSYGGSGGRGYAPDMAKHPSYRSAFSPMRVFEPRAQDRHYATEGRHGGASGLSSAATSPRRRVPCPDAEEVPTARTRELTSVLRDGGRLSAGRARDLEVPVATSARGCGTPGAREAVVEQGRAAASWAEQDAGHSPSSSSTAGRVSAAGYREPATSGRRQILDSSSLDVREMRLPRHSAAAVVYGSTREAISTGRRQHLDSSSLDVREMRAARHSTATVRPMASPTPSGATTPQMAQSCSMQHSPGASVAAPSRPAPHMRTRSVDAGRTPTGRASGPQAMAERRASPSAVSRQDAATAFMEEDCAEYADRFLQGYERCRLLGRGACAVVWLASPSGRQDGGYVAIKQVAKGATGKKRSDTEAARREIMFGSYFFHPGGEPKISASRFPGIESIAKLLDHAETKRDIWLVMEFGGTTLTKCAYEIRGEFLRGERLYRVSHQPLMQAMKRDASVLRCLARQLLSALLLLAEHRIVHSDIKPDNILVEDGEHVPKCRFIDLGSAFTFDCPDSLSLATPEYMPPEALETCVAGRPGSITGGSSLSYLRLGSLGRSTTGGLRKSPGATTADLVLQMQRRSRPWSFDIWSLGCILLELCLGAPLWLSYKCRVADDQRLTSAATGLFAVPGRDAEKIMAKQSEALRQKGLHHTVRNAAGVHLGATGLDLLSQMLAWDPMDRISPKDALDHPWFTSGQHAA
eukprot:TRINITY_DN45053_c0_g1_i1.p1 TRINITY_DN45053_c0_g1~~TRINITY_DN45053_c0_g1_i1.p1  ORF type:complete len:806 (-),score=146.60 TRINITY_DN45053_c0_g1_i1:35-2452(-)